MTKRQDLVRENHSMKKRVQSGVGLVEVLVALLLLAVAVFGFVALQIRAVGASEEAGQNIQAMNLARDLSERMRMNREGFNSYITTTTPPDCNEKKCTAVQLAQYEYAQIQTRAQNQGLKLNVLDCQGVNASFKRKCIYVAWGKTEPINDAASPSTSLNACTKGTAYIPNAQCVIMETYNYE